MNDFDRLQAEYARNTLLEDELAQLKTETLVLRTKAAKLHKTVWITPGFHNLRTRSNTYRAMDALVVALDQPLIKALEGK